MHHEDWTPEDDEHAKERASMTDRDRMIEAQTMFFDVEIDAETETTTLH